MEPAIEIENLSKRYAGGGALIPLPHRFGAKFLSRRGGTRLGFDVDEEMEDEIGEEEEADEPETDKPIQEVWALKNLSLTVAPGTRLAIIGPDGSGKSTLINILGRTSVPTEGTATVRGRVAPMLRSVQGLMFPAASGRENVAHIGRIIGVGREESLARVDDITRLAEIDHKMEERIKTYSTGELQRFAFAVVLGLKPDILLSDNVVAVGDHHFRERCVEHMERSSEDGLTLLFASHNMDMVRRLCTEAIMLDEGQIVQRGSVDEVIRDYERRPSGTTAIDESLAQLEEGHPPSGVSAGVFSATGRPLELLDTNDEALIELEFEVADAPVTMRCVLQFAGTELLLRSVQTEMFDVDEAGRYRVSARIPPGTLPDGAYNGRVGILRFTEHGRELVHRRDDAFRIEVYGGPPELAEQVLPRGAKRTIDLSWSVGRA